MNAKREGEPTRNPLPFVERKSDREVVVRRTVNAPARIVFEAWTKPELFKRWWVPKSAGVTMLGCDMDVRTGGGYRLKFALSSGQEMEFFGKYLEVTPPRRLVWTNEEGGEGGAITTVSFEEQGGQTHLVIHDLYPSKEALEEGLASGALDGMPETLQQLEDLLASLA
ncbi:MAG: SRPBCC family protein [Myxococcota bacterium]